MKIVVLSPDGSVPNWIPRYDQVQVAEWLDSRTLATGADIFVLYKLDAVALQESAHKIRRHEWTFRSLVLSVQSDILQDDAIDIWNPSEAEAMQKIHDYRLLATSVSDTYESQSLRDQILLYLFLRPEKVLAPVKAVEHKHLFYYPILEQFKYAYQDPQSILEEMVSQGLLKKTELLHRLRLCPKCSSPHMQLREECPRCKSIEIDQKPFIHCFGCGQVSPQDDFFTEHGMTCPKCQLKLRQIGVDYDRPLEEGHCSSCEHVFSEPEIKSVCLSCEHQDDPSSWRIGNVHKLILSQPGQMAVRMGGAEQLFTMHEEANLISMPFFRHFLTWSIRLVQRHRSLPFSVVLVQIANTQELYESIGHAATHRALDDFAVRFQSTLRTTDIMSRPETDRFWGLLPHTDQTGCETVVERLAELGNGQNGEKLLGVNCVSLSLPDDLISGEKTDGFISRMLGLASAK